MLLGTLQAFGDKPQTIRLARWVGYADDTWVQSGSTHTRTRYWSWPCCNKILCVLKVISIISSVNHCNHHKTSIYRFSFTSSVAMCAYVD